MRGYWTYDLHFAFAIVFQAEWERFLQACRRVVEGQKGLMRLLASFALRCGENDLERVRGCEAYRLRSQGSVGCEPGLC